MPTDVVSWVIYDELGEPAATIRAATQEDAIEAFCYPSLRKEAYFGPRGGWTCKARAETPAEKPA